MTYKREGWKRVEPRLEPTEPERPKGPKIHWAPRDFERNYGGIHRLTLDEIRRIAREHGDPETATENPGSALPENELLGPPPHFDALVEMAGAAFGAGKGCAAQLGVSWEEVRSEIHRLVQQSIADQIQESRRDRAPEPEAVQALVGVVTTAVEAIAAKKGKKTLDSPPQKAEVPKAAKSQDLSWDEMP